MRTLILGGGGMLGRAVAREARRRDFPVLALSHSEADITDRGSLEGWVVDFRPDLLINCAALTDVDACEQRREEALEINGRAVANVVAAAERSELPVIHISTDYVLDGEGGVPYAEDASAAPLSVYGESKLLGEREALNYSGALTVRTSWLFGPDGSNFVTTIVGLLERGDEDLRVVDDQIGCPTYTPYLAKALFDIAPLERRGILHYRNRDPVSWYQFGLEIARGWSAEERVRRVTTAEFPRPAQRPAYSVLAVDRFEEAVGRQVEAWSSGLQEYLKVLRPTRV